MSAGLSINNRQRLRPLDTQWLRRLSSELLDRTLRLENPNLGIQIVRSVQMIRLNESFLHHAGSTDVITFNYADPPPPPPGSARNSHCAAAAWPALHGELFICMDEAVAQARRYRTTWQQEVVRYLIHGVLHLLGYDDARPGARRIMKREEDRLLKLILDRFPLSKSSRGPKVAA